MSYKKIFEIKDGAAIIPEGTREIHINAFLGCSSLTNIIIPESVKSIRCHAFFRCSSLTSISIPKSVTIIEEAAFADCTSLTSIVVEEGNPIYDSRDNCNAIIETATNTLIKGCSSPTSINIPSSVTSIRKFAFSRCSLLRNVFIPKNVTSIGEAAFAGCDSLTSIVVEEGNPIYDSRDNCNAIIETATNTLIQGCSSPTPITIPSSVTSIGCGAFSGCYSLTSIVIPESVTSIEGNAFYGCSSLEIVHLPAGVSNIELNSFKCCRNLKAIYVPKNKVDYYKKRFPADMHWLIVEEGSDLPVKA